MSYHHIPVMPEEAVAHLDCSAGKIIADCTLGGAGHARIICGKIAPDGLLIGMDQDRFAIENATDALASFGCRFQIFHDSFIRLPIALSRLDLTAVDGILLDLGISRHQLLSSGRGFSFGKDEPLDMRMNPESGITAADIVNSYDVEPLARIFKMYGEERWAKRIARKITSERRENPITTSGRLAQIVSRAVPSVGRHKIHPATRTFMALRIAVNKELEVLEAFMEKAADLLNPGGRLCVISFHSLEDRIVKQHMKSLSGICRCPPGLPECRCGKRKRVRLITKKPVRPTEREVRENPLARSASLRVMEKLIE